MTPRTVFGGFNLDELLWQRPLQGHAEVAVGVLARLQLRCIVGEFFVSCLMTPGAGLGWVPDAEPGNESAAKDEVSQVQEGEAEAAQEAKDEAPHTNESKGDEIAEVEGEEQEPPVQDENVECVD